MTIIEELQLQIQQCQTKIKFIQDACSHPCVDSIAGASTGHFDPSDDCYWYDKHCKLCDKKWREYSK